MHMSNETARAIDTEIRDIVEAGYDRAKYVLTENETQLHLLANALLEYETLSGEEIKALLDTGEFTREDGVNVRPASVPPAGTSIPKTRRRKGPFGDAAPQEIGRASCRERVCQYVLISVVAVSLKKKNRK